MAEALLYPGARWTPLGAQTQDRMTGHDIVCLHTMVGYLTSTDRYFRITNGAGFRGTESHYGVGGKWGPDLGGGLDGAVYQWQDRAYVADANLDGRLRVISVETADNAPERAADIEPWTPNQVDAIADILAWESTPAAHAKCPSSWTCHKAGIPLALIPDTKPGRRGVGYHQQGIEPWLVDGGVRWSSSYGKECPTGRRIAQIPAIITLARQRAAGGDDMPTADEIAAALLAHKASDGHTLNDLLVTTYNRAGVGNQQGTAIQNMLKALDPQLDAIETVLNDEDLQTDRIEAALAAFGSVDALADAVADKVIAGMPDSESMDKETVKAGVREFFAEASAPPASGETQ